MPNHCHGIINIVGAAVGAGMGGPACPPLCVCPDNDLGNIVGAAVGADLRVGAAVGADLRVCPDNDLGEHMKNGMGEHVGSPLQETVQQRPIYEMIRWFKTMTTNECIRNVKQNRWEPFDGKLWQRNYYEQIVRDEISLQRVREYIVNNPRQWQKDKLFAE